MPHTGPEYGGRPSGTEYDNGSDTADTAHGGYKVTWTDRFNKEHTIDLSGDREQLTVVFPNPYGGDWFWYQAEDPQQQRTGFNPTVTWIEATFTREGRNRVRIRSVGFRSEPADPGLWGEIKDKISDVAAIAALGANTAQEAAKIATAAGLWL